MILHNCASTTRVEIVGDENSDTSIAKRCSLKSGDKSW